jgi:hypothetical protein
MQRAVESALALPRKRPGSLRSLGCVALAASLFLAWPSQSVGAPRAIRICHATGSETNPYVLIEISKAGAVNAHSDHPNDVFRRFVYKGEVYGPQGDPSLLGDDCIPPDVDPLGVLQGFLVYARMQRRPLAPPQLIVCHASPGEVATVTYTRAPRFLRGSIQCPGGGTLAARFRAFPRDVPPFGTVMFLRSPGLFGETWSRNTGKPPVTRSFEITLGL